MAAQDYLPLYAQIGRHVRSLILNGELLDGEAIPSEPSLMETFQTTRGTVRQAIGELVTEGLVRRVQGKGTFVQFRPMTHSIWNFGGFSDTMRGRGGIPISRVVEHEVIEAGGTPQLRLVRLRGVRIAETESIFSLDTSHLSLELFPGLDTLDFENASLYDTLRAHYGVHPSRTEMTLSTVIPDAAMCAVLGETRAAPALVTLHGAAFDQHDREIEQIEIVYSSTVQFNISTTLPAARQA
ncbi:GntR family transcriptional regulator [Microterricola viridarii]|uniref:GntR family transcriptional regulator n=1 Tax=Microterricola viridarii TaxID=412690 RepID=A0A1H1TRY5_9MICO|nr:GntR family transcriptional regulator [Microterricola viridarii]SDS62990.1 GntR family transcriptional regulator [Microterricola viridarii]